MRWAGYRKHGHTTWQGPPTRCRRARGSELVAREAESKYEQKSARRPSRWRNHRLREERDTTILSRTILRDSVVKESRAGAEQETVVQGQPGPAQWGLVRSVESTLMGRGWPFAQGSDGTRLSCRIEQRHPRGLLDYKEQLPSTKWS